MSSSAVPKPSGGTEFVAGCADIILNLFVVACTLSTMAVGTWASVLPIAHIPLWLAVVPLVMAFAATLVLKWLAGGPPQSSQGLRANIFQRLCELACFRMILTTVGLWSCTVSILLSQCIGLSTRNQPGAVGSDNGNNVDHSIVDFMRRAVSEAARIIVTGPQEPFDAAFFSTLVGASYSIGSFTTAMILPDRTMAGIWPVVVGVVSWFLGQIASIGERLRSNESSPAEDVATPAGNVESTEMEPL